MKFLGLKQPKLGRAPTLPTRDDALDLSARQDELRQRRGSAADIVTGPGGAEAAKGAATLLG